jgi:hypothetical protein
MFLRSISVQAVNDHLSLYLAKPGKTILDCAIVALSPAIVMLTNRGR